MRFDVDDALSWFKLSQITRKVFFLPNIRKFVQKNSKNSDQNFDRMSMMHVYGSERSQIP
jgi:hypothetical protein